MQEAVVATLRNTLNPDGNARRNAETQLREVREANNNSPVLARKNETIDRDLKTFFFFLSSFFVVT